MNTAPCRTIFCPPPHQYRLELLFSGHGLTVRLLVPCARTRTAELLGLAPPVVGNEEGAVVLDEGLLELVLGVLVDVFLVVGDDGLGDGLADGVDLGRVATARDADADVDVGKLTTRSLARRKKISEQGGSRCGESIEAGCVRLEDMGSLIICQPCVTLAQDAETP
jgi:hypothetical protein